MNCVKCGREIEESQAFCNICLEQMKDHPVKPGTPIQLPVRKPAPVEKKRPQKKALSSEQLIKQQRKLLRRLLFVILALLVALGVMTVALLDALHVISVAAWFQFLRF